MPRTGGGSQSGFTLIEMIVVIVIMGLVAGMVMLRQPWHSAGLDLASTERTLASAFQLARSRAIAQDRDVVVVTAANGFSFDGTVWTLPAGQAMSPSRLVFTPDGQSSGGTVLLASAGTRIAVNVNWLTGRVRAQSLAAP
jgi:general secretion pathway protein H